MKHPQIPYPFPCEYTPTFKTKHEADVFVETYISEGHIKKCVHLSVGDFLAGTIAVNYGPKCSEHSFITLETGARQSEFYGCDKNCRRYEAAWWEKTKKWLKIRYWEFRRFVVGTTQWYASLGHITQVIIALALLALASTPWRGAIIDILKIIYSGR